MITRILFTLTMNRELTEDDIVSPGGYEIEVAGEKIGFDFYTSYSSFYKNQVSYEAVDLDISTFPEAAKITYDLMKKAMFTEFYVDTDDDETLYPINIGKLMIEFDNDSFIILTQKKLADIYNIFRQEVA